MLGGAYDGGGAPPTGQQGHVFTARRNARIASAVLAIAIPSVCSLSRTPQTTRYVILRLKYR